VGNITPKEPYEIEIDGYGVEIELRKLVNISSELGGIISYIIATAHFIIFGYWIGWRWPVCFQPRIRLIKSTFARYGLFFMLNIVIGLAVSIFGLS
jgi:hypothetical protein